ncbi:hypothetical protein ACFCVO_15380 [Agromyces sp. NPDC056379]|uniref:hypothetical protein n=1 Tax=unclassified Agromyces TaxID=2639701 RepID=UPI0035D793CF
MSVAPEAGASGQAPGFDGAIRNQLIEAVAWWRAGLPDGRAVLACAATDALSAGAGGTSLAEAAGLPADENPFSVDALIDRMVDECDLRGELSSDVDVVATRRICRMVLAGELTERELSRWVHDRFHHESESEVLERLAQLDDDYDLAESTGGTTQPIARSIRRLAEQIIAVG